MILLSGHSLTPEKKIRIESMNLRIRERDSTATITLPGTGTDGVSINKWLKDDTDPGAGMVWRVRNIQQVFSRDTVTMQLEHIIATLKDKILFGEITPATITGTDGATTCTARQAVNYILGQQSDWTLYQFGYDNVSNPYKFDGDTLYDALEKVTETLDDAWWTLDTTVYPFRISITEKASGVGSELRPDRNLTAISKTIDMNGMYTRFYPIGKDDLHITGNYVSKNESTYGVICRVETDQSLETEAELRAWANERLGKHAEPMVNIRAEGLNLAQATGESLDQLRLGRLCRVPLPEFSTTIQERIVELNYRDKIAMPEVVEITMANSQEDITRILANEIKTGSGRAGSGGRKAARQQKEDHAWFEDTDEHVAMVAEGIVGVDAQGNPNWTRLAEILVDGTGIHAGVKDIIDELDHFQTDFEMNESKISLVVGRYNGQNYIKAGEICLAINEDGGSDAIINADRIIIGELEDEDLDSWASDAKDGTGTFAKFLTVRTLTAQEITTLMANIGSADISVLDADDMYCDQLVVDQSCTLGAAQMDSIELGNYSAFTDCLVSASVSGNTLTLTYASGDTVNFSKSGGSGRVTEFLAYAPAGATDTDGNTNNNDGYFISGSGSSATVGIVVNGRITADGYSGQQNEYDSLFTAPKNVYLKGLSDAWIGWSDWNNGSRSTLYFYNQWTGGYTEAVANVRWKYY